MFKKFLCCALSAIMLVSVLSVGAYAYQGTDYTIVNPYETVDWDTWTTYKANLHTHSTASDGRVDLPEMIGLYYDLGYDVLALTLLTMAGIKKERFTLLLISSKSSQT